MTTIRKVSDKEGEEILRTTEAKANNLRDLLVGATVKEVFFENTWMNQRPVKEIVVEKDGRVFLLSVESESSWEGSTIDWLEVRDVKTHETLSGECGQP